MIDIRDILNNPAKGFAREFIDSMPSPLFLADRDYNVVFSNTFFSQAFDNKLDKINDDWPEKLARLGITGLTVEKLKESILKLYESETNEIEAINLGKYAYIILTKITVLTETEINKLVLVVLRGVRK